ncbi:hypothetical protein [Lacinutrix sp.]|uniref:hypothetical protein n=1 Tax=Lacinutrix sp. TaxID=1937692 RepID=UPI00262C1A6B|nr:hypothetical protein [Lacinutrix sp.]MDG1715089.1 hypothetical protein [Lacinutrix sp.]
MKYCTNCGAATQNSSKFCGECGNKIEKKSTKDILPENSEDSKEIKTDEFWNKLKIDEKQIKILSDFGTGPDIFDWDDDLLEFSFPNHIQKLMDCFCLTRDEIEELEKLSSDKRGVIKYPNKEIYIGELSNGFRNGFGVYFENEGDIDLPEHKNEDNFIMTYNGFWVDDKRSGKGFEVNNFYRTLSYKGEWENDLYNGKGIKYGTKKAKYIGNYKNGSLHGKGKWLGEDGGVGFEGDFKDDDRHGYGVNFHYLTKNKYCEGKWEFDKFIEGNIYNSDGVIEFIGKYDEYKNLRDLDDDDETIDLEPETNEEMILEDGTINPELYLSTFVDNETTFLGHENITTALNTKSKDINDLFHENFSDFFESFKEKKVDFEYHFMYYNHQRLLNDSFLLVLTLQKDNEYEIVTLIVAEGKADMERSCCRWDGNIGHLKVLKEKKLYASIQIVNSDFDGGDLSKVRLYKPKNGFLDAPWAKWKYKLTDIVAAINDACEEYNKYRV